MNEYKLKKYIDKLKNTDIHSDKFGIYLQKVNFYGGTYGNYISSTTDKKADDWTSGAWQKIVQLEKKCQEPLYNCAKVPLIDKDKCEEQNKIYSIACEKKIEEEKEQHANMLK